MRSMYLMPVWIVVALIGPLTATNGAEPIEFYVPDRALGFVVVHDLEASSDRIGEVFDRFGLPIPSPLTLVKLSTGFNEGFDTNGDLLIGLVAGRRPGGEPGPFVLVPVDDYAAFARSLDADPDGQISAVRIAGQRVLCARRGEYALLMNTDFRAAMERIVAGRPAVPASLQLHQAWCGAQNVAAILLPGGRDELSRMARRQIEAALQQAGETTGNSAIQAARQRLKHGLQFANRLVSVVDDEVEFMGVGIELDTDLNVKAVSRIGIDASGAVVAFLQSAPPGGDLKEDVPGGPLLAATIPWSAEWLPAVQNWAVDLLKMAPDTFGLEQPRDDDSEQLRESVGAFFEGVRGIRVWMNPGQGDAPLLSNMYAEFDVTAASAYLDAYEKSIQVWNEVLEAAETDIPTSYRLERIDLAGRPAIKQVFDYSAGLENEPDGVRKAMEQIFGGDGAMVSYVAVVDDRRVLIGYATAQAVAATVEQQRAGTDRLTDDATIAVAAEALPAGAPMQGYISPQGCVNWARRWMANLGANRLIEYPESPPIGVAFNRTDFGIEGTIVVPASALATMGDYVRATR